jgi:exodeoxyribonuclease-3
VYKLRFLERLTLHLETLLSYDERVVIGGDFNIAPEDRDTYDPEAWQDQVLCTPEERTAFQRFLDLGYTDAWRHHHPETTDYSWWDYRAGQWRRNQGLRIDHLLLNAAALAELTEAGIDRTPRGWERPSDHTPVWVRLR